MQRLTARLLLVLLLVGTIAPAALAISAPEAHACCMRKPLQERSSRSLQAQIGGNENHNCCPPVTTTHWAQLGSGTTSSLYPPLVYVSPGFHPLFRSSYENILRPVRGPPVS